MGQPLDASLPLEAYSVPTQNHLRRRVDQSARRLKKLRSRVYRKTDFQGILDLTQDEHLVMTRTTS